MRLGLGLGPEHKPNVASSGKDIAPLRLHSASSRTVPININISVVNLEALADNIERLRIARERYYLFVTKSCPKLLTKRHRRLSDIRRSIARPSSRSYSSYGFLHTSLTRSPVSQDSLCEEANLW